MEMSTPNPRKLQYTKLALPALALRVSVLDKTPERCTCPRREARGTARVPQEAEEDGMKKADYSFQRANHLRYDIPNFYFHDEDCDTIGDKQRIPEMRMQTPAEIRADRGIQEPQEEEAECLASPERGEEFLTAQPCDGVVCEVLPGLPAPGIGVKDVVLPLPEQEVSHEVLHDVKEASIMQPAAPSVVLCAKSAAHKSEVQLTLEAGSGLLQTNPNTDTQYSSKLKTVLNSVHHPEEGDGS